MKNEKSILFFLLYFQDKAIDNRAKLKFIGFVGFFRIRVWF